ncbi:MAG TPA: hypothetical protein VK151_14930 [Fluviicola sp.]|nr:hypothetical protein [Fluviicola sp.]
MTPKILKMPHWKLFILVFGIPFAGMMIAMIGTIFMAVSQREPEPATFIPIMIVFPLIGLFGAVVQLYWMWSMATGLQSYMHPDMRKLRVKRFKVFFFIPWIYFAVFMSTIIIITTQIEPSDNGDPSDILWAIPLFILAFLMHFFSMFCIFYTLYFIAKTLVSAELQREAHFSDYIGDFFLIWFFPVGVWFIQPRVNKIVSEGQFSNYEVID